MRAEFGNAQLTPQQVASALNGATVPVHNGDDPVASAEAGHPNLVWLDDTPADDRIGDFMLLVDFRYRIRFLETVTGRPRYELSLDKARRYQKDENGEYTVYEDIFELELEALTNDGDGGSQHTEAEIDELFRLVSWFEAQYPMLEPQKN